MKSPYVRTWLVAAAAALALFTVSCAAEPTADSPDSSEAEAAAPEATTDNSSSDAAGEDDAAEADFTSEELEGALVASFPADVPLYNGRIVSSLSALSDVSERPEWNVVVATDDPFDTVEASVRDGYSSNGWEITSDMEIGGGYQLTAHSAGYIVSITSMDFGESEIEVNYGVSAK